jgi:predicted peptidase
MYCLPSRVLKLVVLCGLTILSFFTLHAQTATPEKPSPPGAFVMAQNEASHQGIEAAVQGFSSSKGMVFDEKTLRDLAALEKKVNERVSKKDLKRLSKEEQEARVKAQEEANLAWASYKETCLQWLEKRNVERAKQGKELYQEFLIPRGTATYMSFDVKIEDLKADVHDGGYRGKMRYRYFAPETGEGKKVPLILFLHAIDWGRGANNTYHGTDNRYQFKDPEILAFVQPEAQKKYPCFLVAPQQITQGAWCSPSTDPNVALKSAVDIVDELIAQYPQIDTNRLYVTGPATGGAGAFDAAAKYPDKFAAVVSMSGGRDPNAFKEKQKTTAWISYCEEGEDPAVYELSKAMSDLFSGWGGDSRLVVYPGTGHRSWEYGYVDEKLYEWLFRQSL